MLLSFLFLYNGYFLRISVFSSVFPYFILQTSKNPFSIFRIMEIRSFITLKKYQYTEKYLFYGNTKLNNIEKVWICRENICFTKIQSLKTLKKYGYTEKITVLRNTKLNNIEKVWICRENIRFTEIRSSITLKKYEYTEKIYVLQKYKA